MIRLKPVIEHNLSCDCGGKYNFADLLWQGLHVCEKFICSQCAKTIIRSLPVNQAGIEQYVFFPDSGLIHNADGNIVSENWFSSRLRAIGDPVGDHVDMEVKVYKKSDEVIILNTLDYIYGHSLLFLMNLQRIIKADDKPGIIVIVQPMLKWLIPKQYVAEIWTVKLEFKQLMNYHSGLSEKINSELSRFNKVWLSKGHIIPTNENLKIEQFTGIMPYDFEKPPGKPRITFIWREDPDRLWIRNIYLLKGFKKLGFRNILKPFHYLRVLKFFRLIKKELGLNYTYSVAGLGRSFQMPSYIDDKRFESFNEDIEKLLCNVYAESELVIGIHGSSMLLPSAHAGMAISLMPSKRWGNFAEDLLFNESDVRLAAFQRRIVPLNLSIYDIRDIVIDMIRGRDYFIKKFIHSEEL